MKKSLDWNSAIRVLISEERNLEPFLCLTLKSGKNIYGWPIFMCLVFLFEIHSYLWACDRKSYWLHDKLSPLMTIYNASLEKCEKGSIYQSRINVSRVARYHARMSSRVQLMNSQVSNIAFVEWRYDSDRDFYGLIIMTLHGHYKTFLCVEIHSRFEMIIPWVSLLFDTMFDRSVKPNKDIPSCCKTSV